MNWLGSSLLAVLLCALPTTGYATPGDQSPPTAGAQTTPANPAPAAAPPPSVTPARAVSGVAVVLVGPFDPVAGVEVRNLARRTYQSDALRPAQIDEATATLLTGAPLGDAPAQPNAQKLAELLAGVTSDLSNAVTIASLDALASELPVRALLLYIPQATGPMLRIAHIDRSVAGVKTRLDPAVLIASAAAEGQSIDWSPVVASAEKLLLERPATLEKPPGTASAKPATPGAPPTGPRKDQLKNAPSAPPEQPSEETSFFESPWFWVAVGGVAAAGLSVLVVSQVTDVGQGSVALSGKVVP